MSLCMPLQLLKGKKLKLYHVDAHALEQKAGHRPKVGALVH